MIRSALAFTFAGLGFAVLAAADPPEVASPLDKLTAKSKTARPKGTPADVLAVVGDRGPRVDCGAFSPSGKYLALGGPGDSVTLWQFPDVRAVASVRNKETVCLAFDPAGKLLAAGDSAGDLRLWKVGNGTLTPHATAAAAHKDGPVWSVAFFPDGKTVATGGSDGAIKLWDITKPKPTVRATLTGHTGQVRGLAVNAGGTVLASAGWKDETFRLWDVAAAKPAGTHTEKFKALVTSVSFAAGADKLAVGVADGKVRVYAVEAGKPKDPVVIAAKKDKVANVAFAPDGESVAAVVYWDANEDRLCVFDLAGKAVYEGGFGQRIQGLAAAADGRHLAAVHERTASLVRVGEPAKAPKK